ncbi:DUF3137 domain-containing protein [Kordiimonas sp. SCSIO 12610]|uniref:DUF3137 domain-containing protein n=1 Tax=Kordiimonas sp. SCSIO 12610 TaxID=2829597 RepID=UPI00210CBA99|nr:DUF3137 domain-containing protein [Kordiimonas sp. SCSIO 12610]UTW55996.1 DUF3137 domain-containing protein [Kordiimonas sp. SCSIO 12610]
MTDTEVPKNHNKALKTALIKIDAQVQKAQSDDDLLKAIKFLEGFKTPVKFDNRTTHIVCLPLLIISLIAAIVGSQEPTLEIMLVIAGVIGAVTLIAYLWVIFSRRSSLSQLSDDIHTKTILFDNGLTDIPVGGKMAARRLGSQFLDFQRGNHTREIRRTLKGHYTGEEHSFDYRYHHFHYVNKRRETYTTTVNGKTQIRTRTVYDHFDRFAFIIPFQFARSIAVVQDRNKHRGIFWETASIDFNKKFGVYAGSEQIAAKFLSPKIIVEIERLDALHHSINLEFNSEGDLCLSFTNGDTLRALRKYGLEDPQAFADEIKGHTNLGKLDMTLDIVHTLMKYSDSNFTDYHTSKNTAPWG